MRECQHDGILTAQWRLGDGTTLSLLANLSDQSLDARSAQTGADRAIWGGEPPERLPPWSVFLAHRRA